MPAAKENHTMSMTIKTVDGEELFCRLLPFPSNLANLKVRGKKSFAKFSAKLKEKESRENWSGWYLTLEGYEIPLEEFCELAAHYLGGGAFGWGKGCETPEPVNKILTELFNKYELKNGKWVRKTRKA